MILKSVFATSLLVGMVAGQAVLAGSHFGHDMSGQRGWMMQMHQNGPHGMMQGMQDGMGLGMHHGQHGMHGQRGMHGPHGMMYGMQDGMGRGMHHGQHGMHGMHDGMHGQHGLHGGMHGMLDADGDGMVTPDEATAQLAAMLKDYDADGDGTLSIGEYEALHSAMIRKTMVDRFQHLDADGDGQITAKEMDAPARAMSRMQQHHMMMRGVAPASTGDSADTEN